MQAGWPARRRPPSSPRRRRRSSACWCRRWTGVAADAARAEFRTAGDRRHRRHRAMRALSLLGEAATGRQGAQRDGARLHHRRAAFRRRQDHRDARRSGGAGAGAASRCAPPRPGRIISIRRSTPPRSARRASISTAWAMPPALARQRWRRRRRPRRRSFIDRRRDGPVRRRRRIAGPQRRDRRPRRAFRLAGGAGARRVAAGAIGGRRGARICGARSRRADRRRHPQSRRQRAAPRDGRRRHRARSAFRCSAPCRATATLALPERHLGLVQAGEHADLDALIDRLAAMAERHLDLDAIAAVAAPLTIGSAAKDRPRALPPPGQRIALAQRSGFQLRLSACGRRPGAMPAPRSSPFSPLADESAAGTCRLLLAAGRLSGAACRRRSPRRENFTTGLRRFAETRPVHGECGGYMVLGESLEDAAGTAHAMTGTARPRHELCQAQIASRLPQRAAAVRRRARRARARPCAATNSITRSLSIAGERRLVRRTTRRRRPRARRIRRPPRPRQRHVLPRHRAPALIAHDQRWLSAPRRRLVCPRRPPRQKSPSRCGRRARRAGWAIASAAPERFAEPQIEIEQRLEAKLARAACGGRTRRRRVPATRVGERIGPKLCQRRDRRGADKAVEQNRDALSPRRQSRAEDRGELAAAEAPQRLRAGRRAPQRDAPAPRSITSRFRPRPPSSTPVPRPAQRAPPPPNSAAATAAAAVVLPMPISPRQTRSQSGDTASIARRHRGDEFASPCAGACGEVRGRPVERERNDAQCGARDVRASWLIAAPPAAKFATICAVTSAG